MAKHRLTEEQRKLIEIRAYLIWESEGRPHGREQEHWAQAEAEVLAAHTPPERPAKAAKAVKAAKAAKAEKAAKATSAAKTNGAAKAAAAKAQRAPTRTAKIAPRER